MQLEVDKKHKTADLSNIRTIGKDIKITLMGLSLAVSLLSGHVDVKAATDSHNVEDMVNKESVDDNTVVKIPEIYEYNVANECGKSSGDEITVGDLKKIDYLFFSYDGSSLDWLNYCDNLNELLIIMKSNDYGAISKLKGLEGLEGLSILGTSDRSTNFSGDDFSFISKSPNLKNLSITGANIEPGYIEKLNNLESLSLQNCINQDLDYSKLTFLDELDFSSSGPYDVSMFFNNDEYTTLVNSGVDVTIGTGGENNINSVKSINQKLDAVVKELGINENDSLDEKYQKILIHVLEKLEYNQEVSEALANNTEYRDLTASFYQGGYLYGALEKDSAICGNYAAYVTALCDRVGVPTAFLFSDTHAWNLVGLSEVGYSDATWMDESTVPVETQEDLYDDAGNIIGSSSSTYFMPAVEAIKNGEAEKLDWYMADPTDFADIEENNSHDVLNLPSYFKIEPFEEEVEENIAVSEEEKDINKTEGKEDKKITEKDKKDIKEKKFKVTIGKKTFIVAGSVVGALLFSGGLGFVIHNQKKKKRERERRRRAMYNNYDLDPLGNNYGSPYGNDTVNFSSRRR